MYIMILLRCISASPVLDFIAQLIKDGPGRDCPTLVFVREKEISVKMNLKIIFPHSCAQRSFITCLNESGFENICHDLPSKYDPWEAEEGIFCQFSLKKIQICGK